MLQNKINNVPKRQVGHFTYMLTFHTWSHILILNHLHSVSTRFVLFVRLHVLTHHKHELSRCRGRYLIKNDILTLTYFCFPQVTLGNRQDF